MKFNYLKIKLNKNNLKIYLNKKEFKDITITINYRNE